MTEPSAPISVLIADDDEDQRLLARSALVAREDARYRVTPVPDGRSALEALKGRVFDVALLDITMPGLDGLAVLEAIADDPSRPEVIFVTGTGTIGRATTAMKLGAYDFVEKPFDPDRLVTLVWKAAEARRFRSRSARLQAAVRRGAGDASLITQDPRMLQVLELIERVAPSDVSVLVVGESGTGKELVARALHRLSRRDREPWVALNCAAVSESLAESELFGHEKGAFTGAASRRIGLVEMADGGTLFLDEIGDLTPALQAKLLRALEIRRFRRLGGVKELPVNFRLVSATNAPLRRRVEEGRFRADLYYRINAIVLELPPLRERREDILLLAHHFLARLRPNETWTIAPEAAAVLESYPWPGNVRELRNVVERAALLARGATIEAGDLQSWLAAPEGSGLMGTERPAVGDSGGDGAGPEGQGPRDPGSEGHGGGYVVPADVGLSLDRLERWAVERALERTAWHQGHAAEILGISDRTLRRKIRAYAMHRPD